MPRVGQRVRQNERFMTVKVAGRDFDLESPIDGVVSAINPLQDRPAELEAYTDGWVAFVEPTKRMPANLKKLLYADTAMEWLSDSSDKLIETLSPGVAADGGIIKPDVYVTLPVDTRVKLIEEVVLGG
jgi:glycine cleavage system H lipoate-binding protein